MRDQKSRLVVPRFCCAVRESKQHVGGRRKVRNRPERNGGRHERIGENEVVHIWRQLRRCYLPQPGSERRLCRPWWDTKFSAECFTTRSEPGGKLRETRLYQHAQGLPPAAATELEASFLIPSTIGAQAMGTRLMREPTGRRRAPSSAFLSTVVEKNRQVRGPTSTIPGDKSRNGWGMQATATALATAKATRIPAASLQDIHTKQRVHYARHPNHQGS